MDLSIFVEAAFPGSYHDANCLRHTDLGKNWRKYFDTDETSPYPLEYLLGDPGFLGMDHFILRRLDERENVSEHLTPVMEDFNKFHAGYRVSVEWGIGGIKAKFKKFFSVFTNRRYHFESMFKTAVILTNFLHRRRMDMTPDYSSVVGVEGQWF